MLCCVTCTMYRSYKSRFCMQFLYTKCYFVWPCTCTVRMYVQSVHPVRASMYTCVHMCVQYVCITFIHILFLYTYYICGNLCDTYVTVINQPNMLPQYNMIFSYARLSSCRRVSSRNLSTSLSYDRHCHGRDRWGIDRIWEWNLWNLDMSPHYLTLSTWPLQQGVNCDVNDLETGDDAPTCSHSVQQISGALVGVHTLTMCFETCKLLHAPLWQGRGAVSDPSKWPCWLQLDGLESARRSGCTSLLVLQVLHL